jgi:hypothetical protein
MKNSQTPPATHQILITGHFQNGKLDLKDASGNDGSTITVDSDDDVIWKNEDQEIDIDDIIEDNSTDHFKQKPSSANNWHAKVDGYSDGRTHVIKYAINWHTAGGEAQTHDPLIRINPHQVGQL